MWREDVNRVQEIMRVDTHTSYLRGHNINGIGGQQGIKVTRGEYNHVILIMQEVIESSDEGGVLSYRVRRFLHLVLRLSVHLHMTRVHTLAAESSLYVSHVLRLHA